MSWDDMALGEDDVITRECFACGRQVHNLEAMDPADADAFLLENVRLEHDDGRPSECVKLFQRPDGRVMTSECDVGRKRRHARSAAVALAVTFALASAFFFHVVFAVPRMVDPRDEGDVMAERERPAVAVPAKRVEDSWVFIQDDDFDDEPRAAPKVPTVIVDEEALARDDDPENERFGTSARTERAVALRRAKDNPVIPGTIYLIGWNPRDYYFYYGTSF